MGVTPSPFVYWAQKENSVSLRIDLKSVVKPEFEILEDKIKFTADGIGAHGLCKYKFSLDLYSPIKNDTANGEKPVTVRVSDSRVDVVLQKQKAAWWPRLTAQPQKPAWLKVNFDLWVPENGDMDKEEECRDIMKDYPGMYDELQKEEMGYKKEDAIKTYMVFYNLCQLTGYLYCASVMAIRFAKLGFESATSTYDHVGQVMKYLQLLQVMETLHALLGLTRGAAFMAAYQDLSRLVITVFHFEYEPRLRTDSVVCLLFVTWSLAEIVRYSYYITHLYKKEVAVLSWLRYSLWVVLYPVGIACETVIMFRRAAYLEESSFNTISLPNTWNFTLDIALIVKAHAYATALSTVYLMAHMYMQRKRRLSPKVDIKKVK